jgi:hypothetical protein
MIEVNMGQQQVTDIVEPNALCLQAFLQAFETTRRSGIYQCYLAGALHDSGRDGVTPTEELQVDIAEATRKPRHQS